MANFWRDESGFTLRLGSSATKTTLILLIANEIRGVVVAWTIAEKLWFAG